MSLHCPSKPSIKICYKQKHCFNGTLGDEGTTDVIQCGSTYHQQDWMTITGRKNHGLKHRSCQTNGREQRLTQKAIEISWGDSRSTSWRMAVRDYLGRFINVISAPPSRKMVELHDFASFKFSLVITVALASEIWAEMEYVPFMVTLFE